MDEFQFKPRELVANIARLYVNLGGDDDFCRAVFLEGRSYSSALFDQAETVLWKINEPAGFVLRFNDVARKIQVSLADVHEFNANTVLFNHIFVAYLEMRCLE